jgi:hypothetical protein
MSFRSPCLQIVCSRRRKYRTHRNNYYLATQYDTGRNYNQWRGHIIKWINDISKSFTDMTTPLVDALQLIMSEFIAQFATNLTNGVVISLNELLISINELLISINELLISINELLISIIQLLISIIQLLISLNSAQLKISWIHLLISIKHLLISVIHLLISVNALLISVNELLISLNIYWYQ